MASQSVDRVHQRKLVELSKIRSAVETLKTNLLRAKDSIPESNKRLTAIMGNYSMKDEEKGRVLDDLRGKRVPYVLSSFKDMLFMELFCSVKGRGETIIRETDAAKRGDVCTQRPAAGVQSKVRISREQQQRCHHCHGKCHYTKLYTIYSFSTFVTFSSYLFVIGLHCCQYGFLARKRLSSEACSWTGGDASPGFRPSDRFDGRRALQV